MALGCPTGVVGFGRVPAMAPEVLGNRYEIGRPIGRGAMTRVLEAWDRHGHRRVALKVLVDRLAADEAFLERLEREARTAASLSHRNIAAVHAVGADTRTRFVVSELVEGPSLPDMLADRGPPPPVGAARVAASVCAALAAAHASGVVHGHLTPANILLAVDGRVKVTDFRLAQAVTPPAAGGDPATDLQGVGRCLVAMLTGREPPADAPIRLGPDVPAELAAIVLRAAGNHDRADRSAEQLRDDLDWFLASAHHGAASTVRPDLTPGHDRATMAALACAPAVQLVPRLAAGPPDRQVAFADRPPPADRRRHPSAPGCPQPPGRSSVPANASSPTWWACTVSGQPTCSPERSSVSGWSRRRSATPTRSSGWSPSSPRQGRSYPPGHR